MMSLTPLQLAQAFPEPEYQAMARKRIKVLRQAINESWDPILKAIMDSDLDDIDPALPSRFEDLDVSTVESRLIDSRTKWFWVNVWRLSSEHDPMSKQVSFYQQYLQIIKRKNMPGKRDLTSAKAFPITELYNFQQVRRHGRNIVALCPFHYEDTPSFYVYGDKNNFHCYGCGAHGDAIAFYMRINDCTFLDAVKFLGGEEDVRPS